MADMHQTETDFAIGDDLYGVSIRELEDRIVVLKAEIERIQAELTKKQKERSAAEHLFGG